MLLFWICNRKTFSFFRKYNRSFSKCCQSFFNQIFQLRHNISQQRNEHIFPNEKKLITRYTMHLSKNGKSFRYQIASVDICASFIPLRLKSLHHRVCWTVNITIDITEEEIAKKHYLHYFFFLHFVVIIFRLLRLHVLHLCNILIVE